jgi:hypothetical protein
MSPRAIKTCLVSSFLVFGLLMSLILVNVQTRAQDAAPKHKEGFRIESAGGPLSANPLYVTTINKGAFQTPTSVYFQTLSKSFSSSTISILDQNVSSGSASGIMTSGGSGSMQMLYAYSTTLDGTLSVFNNTYGSGSTVGTAVVNAGVPYEWDSLTSGTTTLIVSPTNSLSFTAGTTNNGVPTPASSTVFNAAALYP